MKESGSELIHSFARQHYSFMLVDTNINRGLLEMLAISQIYWRLRLLAGSVPNTALRVDACLVPKANGTALCMLL